MSFKNRNIFFVFPLVVAEKLRLQRILVIRPITIAFPSSRTSLKLNIYIIKQKLEPLRRLVSGTQTNSELGKLWIGTYLANITQQYFKQAQAIFIGVGKMFPISWFLWLYFSNEVLTIIECDINICFQFEFWTFFSGCGNATYGADSAFWEAKG